MCVSHRHLATSLGLALALTSSSALAWVEATVESDVITLDLERSGQATVRHEIMMRVKGGPLNAFELEGVDADAVPLPDGVAAPASAGGGPATPLPLLLQKREDSG